MVAPGPHKRGLRETMRMLFLRDYRSFFGGHLKYLHYLKHSLDIDRLHAELFLAPSSLMEASNIFLGAGVPILSQLRPADAYFIAGLDWAMLDEANIDTRGRPVINLVQGVRHADPADPRYRYLSRPALRICVSPEVEAALLSSGRVNGPVVHIRAGIDLPDLAATTAPKKTGRVFVAAAKAPALGVDIAAALSAAPGLDLNLATGMLDRRAFLARMAEAEICVTLPDLREGFFLPALEAMVLGAAVVVPDCVGNRSFCRHGETCLVPARQAAEIAAAVTALAADSGFRARLALAGRATASGYSMSCERETYIDAALGYLNGWGRRDHRLTER